MAGGRRRYLGVGVAALLAAVGASGCSEAPKSAPAQPHIFLITSDALRPDHLSLNGYARETSPNLDRFAAHAANYTQSVTPIPKTGASFTSMLSGVHPVEHGVQANRDTIPAEVSLLAERLSAAGYQTGAFLGNPVLSAANGYARGFDRFAIYGAGDPVTLVNAAFLVWLREVDWSRPIFAWVHYIDPHGPYTPPARLLSLFADDAIARADSRTVPLDYDPLPGWPLDYTIGALPRYQRLGNLDRVAAYVARYDAEIRHMDEAFGMLVEELERRGVLDDSALLFASDHGESVGGEDDYWFEHGWIAHEAGLRTALLVKTPRQRDGRRVDDPASVLDVAPTLLALAGLAPDAEVTGRDLLAAAPRDATPLVVANASTYPSRYFGLRAPDWKYVQRVPGTAGVPGEPPDEQLFDLRADPAGRHDVASQRPDRVASLREELQTRLAAITRRMKPGRADLDADTRRQLEALGYAE